MNDHDIHKLTGAYATDALDDLERARFEQHLAGCEDCRVEVSELREAAARMATITETTPPESLRSSVLAGIAQVRPLPPLTDDRSDDRADRTEDRADRADDEDELPPAATRSDTTAPDEPARLVPGTSRRGLRRWAPALVAAVLALVAGVTLATWQPWAPITADRVLEAADRETVALDLGDAGRAEVVRSNSLDRAVIVTEDMVLPPEGRVYQLWFQPAGSDEMVPAGLMPRDEDNTVVLEGSASEATTVGITVEPAGGSEEPTSAPIALFDLTEAT